MFCRMAVEQRRYAAGIVDTRVLRGAGCGYPPEVSMDRIRIGYPAGYLQFFWIRIGFGYLFLKKIGSGQDQDICLISISKFS